jgi:hypothetical protein
MQPCRRKYGRSEAEYDIPVEHFTEGLGLLDDRVGFRHLERNITLVAVVSLRANVEILEDAVDVLAALLRHQTNLQWMPTDPTKTDMEF